MNTQTTKQNSAFSTRTLVDFPHLSEESVISLIETLGFKMGLTELRFCQNYFKENATENPTIHELKIIDRVFYDSSVDPRFLAVASFATNDKTVANTYTDIMNRRRSVSPHYSEPCSLHEFLNILPSFFKGCEKPLLSGVSLFGGKYKDIEAAASCCKKIAGIDDCSAVISLKKSNRKSKVAEGDTLYAVLKSFNPFDDFEERLLALLQSSEMITASKGTFILKDCGIFTELAKLKFGVKLNTKSFEGKDGCVSPFEHFAEADLGSISVFDKSEAADMLVLAHDIGLRVVELGKLEKSDFIRGSSKDGETLSINKKLLRSVAFSSIVTAEADGETPSIEESAQSIYIIIDGKRMRMNTAVCGGENYFMAGFNTVVHAYALSAVSGATQTIGAGVYTLPLKNPTSKDVGRSLELILGAYRAQYELGIYDVCPQIIFGDAPSLSFHTLSDATLNPPSKTALAGSSIRYAEIEKTESGLPDTKAIKALYSLMNKLTAEQKVSAILPITDNINESLDKIIDSSDAVKKDTNGIKSSYGSILFATSDPNIEIGGEIASIPSLFTEPTATQNTEYPSEAQQF